MAFALSLLHCHPVLLQPFGSAQSLNIQLVCLTGNDLPVVWFLWYACRGNTCGLVVDVGCTAADVLV